MCAYLLENPYALAVSITWSSERETVPVLQKFMSLIASSLSTAEMFQRTQAPNETYLFRGMICYYGQHYVSIFQDYSAAMPRFLLFDDAKIRSLGNWEQVKAECLRAHYQPVLLLYEKQNIQEEDLLTASLEQRALGKGYVITVTSVV